jgi:hypothetical protein
MLNWMLNKGLETILKRALANFGIEFSITT